jgi:hypothetical protein
VQLKAHKLSVQLLKLSDAATELLQRLKGPESLNINVEWLKLQP